MIFSGSMVALVTPMNVSGRVDESRLAELIEFHLSAGTQDFIIAGTTRESATLTRAEHLR